MPADKNRRVSRHGLGGVFSSIRPTETKLDIFRQKTEECPDIFTNGDRRVAVLCRPQAQFDRAELIIGPTSGNVQNVFPQGHGHVMRVIMYNVAP